MKFRNTGWTDEERAAALAVQRAKAAEGDTRDKRTQAFVESWGEQFSGCEFGELGPANAHRDFCAPCLSNSKY